jgi:hypothetical protein
MGRVNFDYLPDSPSHHGWQIQPENKQNLTPEYTVAQNSPMPGAVEIRHSALYFMDYRLDQALGMSNLAEFYIRYANGGVFYFRVKVTTRDQSQDREVWLCYLSTTSLREAGPAEWVVPLTGDVMENGWVAAKISLADDVERTYGRQGWAFSTCYQNSAPRLSLDFTYQPL